MSYKNLEMVKMCMQTSLVKYMAERLPKQIRKERFVGKTCTLGLGYGTGWKKLQHTLETSGQVAKLDEAECQNLVRVYRESKS